MSHFAAAIVVVYTTQLLIQALYALSICYSNSYVPCQPPTTQLHQASLSCGYNCGVHNSATATSALCLVHLLLQLLRALSNPPHKCSVYHIWKQSYNAALPPPQSASHAPTAVEHHSSSVVMASTANLVCHMFHLNCQLLLVQ